MVSPKWPNFLSKKLLGANFGHQGILVVLELLHFGAFVGFDLGYLPNLLGWVIRIRIKGLDSFHRLSPEILKIFGH